MCSVPTCHPLCIQVHEPGCFTLLCRPSPSRTLLSRNLLCAHIVHCLVIRTLMTLCPMLLCAHTVCTAGCGFSTPQQTPHQTPLTCARFLVTAWEQPSPLLSTCSTTMPRQWVSRSPASSRSKTLRGAHVCLNGAKARSTMLKRKSGYLACFGESTSCRTCSR